MKFLAALLLAVALVLTPYTVELEYADASSLPWSTFNETLKDVTSVQQAGCGADIVLFARLDTKDGRTFLYYAAENGRYVFAEMVDGKPTTIHYGEQLPSPEHDVIRAKSHQFNGTGPCGYLFPKTT